MRKRGKKKMTGLIIVLVIIALLGIGGATGWSRLSKEHYEARNVSLDGVNFSELKDGTYLGEYAGGMYKWRANKVKVVVSSGKVTAIELISSTDPGGKNTDQAELYNRVIKAQSLEVDAISGATLTSKAYLKAVENALEQAEK